MRYVLIDVAVILEFCLKFLWGLPIQFLKHRNSNVSVNGNGYSNGHKIVTYSLSMKNRQEHPSKQKQCFSNAK